MKADVPNRASAVQTEERNAEPLGSRGRLAAAAGPDAPLLRLRGQRFSGLRRAPRIFAVTFPLFMPSWILPASTNDAPACRGLAA